MAKIQLLVAGVALAALVFASGAADGASMPPPRTLNCVDFHRNADGSWSTVRAVTITTRSGQVTLKPGISLRPGISFSDVDVAAQLDAQCK
jgi:hypothetical protein